MRIPKLLLSVFYFMLIINTLSAQTNLSEGYYVGIAKDTVRGFFNFDNLTYKKILFYTDKTSSTSKKLAPEDIQEIETLDKISIRTFNYTGGEQAELIFITRYVDGSVSLYEGQSDNPDERNVLCISSFKIPEIRKISLRNTKMYLNTYFKGCELGTNFSIKYNKLSVLAAVKEYSKCAYPDSKITQKMGKSSKISVGMGFQTAVFMNKSTYKAPRNAQNDAESNIAPLFGGVVALGISNKFKVYSGINYFQRSFTPNPANITLRSPRELEYIVTANYIEFPLAVHYEFKKPNRSYVPKVFIGAAKLIITQAEIDVYSPQPLYPTKKFDFSFFVGGGIKKAFKNKSSLELNAKCAFDTEDPLIFLRIDGNRYELSLTYLWSLYDK